jgi:hypothetical protein
MQWKKGSHFEYIKSPWSNVTVVPISDSVFLATAGAALL